VYKHLLKLVVFSVICLTGCASTIRNGYDPDDQKTREFIENTSVDKLTQYQLALNFIAKTFNSANDVIQMKDQDAGIIVLKAIAPFSIVGLTRYVEYTMEVKIKDQKAKITFTLGGLSGGNGFYAQPDCAPPKDQMLKIWSELENIKNGLVIAMSTKDDF
jgi:hypothetical protein